MFALQNTRKGAMDTKTMPTDSRPNSEMLLLIKGRRTKASIKIRK